MKKVSAFVLLSLLSSTLCIPFSQFYPFGGNTVDSNQRLGDGNDVISGRVTLQQFYRFYGQFYSTARISVNGAIFLGTFTDTSYVQNPFPLGRRRFVAPFWADVDTTGAGDVWYRQSTSQPLLDRASTQIRNAFPLQPQFTATSLLIVTWDHVGYFNNRNDKTNTFQCILATNGRGRQTYAIFLYADDEIQWTTGDADGGTNGLGGNPAQVGFNRGDGRDFAIIPASGTAEVIDIASNSNVGVNGVYIFRISDRSIPVVTTCTNVNTGIVYQIGETFQRDCASRCTCRIGGQIDCITVPCDFDGPTCNTNGDPHYNTFDGFVHHYQGTCQYVHVERCTNSEFSIKTRNIAHNSVVSCVGEVTIEAPGVVIVLQRGNPIPVIINTQQASNTDLLLYDSNGVEVRRVSTSVHVFLNRIGIRIFWDGLYRIDVTVSTRLLNQLCGLCGTYNNNPSDDLQRRDGVVATSTVQFGDSWLVPGSCINVGKRDAPGVPECSTDPSVIQEGQSRCSELMGEVFNSCNGVVNATQFIENCEFDYCCCTEADREDCYCDNLAAYAAACADAGVTLSTWRNSFCPIQCPTGMVYQQCGSFCPPTCDDINATAMCQGGCAEGCFCPDGQVLLDGACVDPFVCTACSFMGTLYGDGAQIQPNCSTRCVCQSGQLQCEDVTCFADGPTCYAYGDPHYQTFDLLQYDFQGDCEYVLTTPCDNDEFTVVVGNVAKGMNSSSTQMIRTLVPAENLEIVLGRGNGGTVTINGTSHLETGDGSLMLSGGVEVVRTGGHLHVLLATQGIRIFWDGENRVEVTVSTSWQGMLCGLCGNYNNDDADDFITPGGQQVNNSDVFVTSWAFGDTSNCGTLPQPEFPCFGPNGTIATARCDALQSDVFAACHGTVDPLPFIDDCIDDYCLFCDDSSKEDCLCNILSTYASVCAAAGIVLQDWRDFFCSAQCPAGMLFQQCGQLCPQVCDAPAVCSRSGCAEGCFCPTGQVVDSNGQCVEPEACGGSGGNDPHFFLPLANGDNLCFSVQGEPDFIFSLIRDKYIQMNAQFVLPAEDESHTIANVSTFLGNIGLLVRDPITAKPVIIKVSAKEHSVSVDNSTTVIKDRPVTVRVSDSYVIVTVDDHRNQDNIRKDGSAWLYINIDHGFGLKVRFYKKHLDMFLTNTGMLTKEAHGLLGQFLTSGVVVDTENMLMKFGDRKPISIKKAPAWPYLKINKECWYGSTTDNQATGIIDGVYTDYIVDSLIPLEV